MEKIIVMVISNQDRRKKIATEKSGSKNNCKSEKDHTNSNNNNINICFSGDFY